MLIITDHEGTTLFAKNGFWSRECFILPDESYRKKLKWVSIFGYLLIILLFSLTIIFENIFIIIIGVFLGIYLEHRLVKIIICHCKKTKRRITYREVIIENTNKNSQLGLLFITIIFSYFSWLVIEDIISGKEGLFTSGVILAFLLFMTHYMLYAIYLKRHPPTF